MLIPDFSATKSIDPQFERMTYEVEHLRESRKELADKPELADKLAELDAILQDLDARQAEYAQDTGRPSLDVGFIPAAKLTEIKLALYDGFQMSGKEQVLAMLDSHRELVKWGVKGWDMPDGRKFETQSVTLRGRKFDVASEAAIDLIERMEWLPHVARIVREWNEISADDKKK